MKASQFRIAAEIKPDKHDWGLGRWISHPLSTGPKQLTVLDAIIMPGQRHDFHKHPDQEEVLFVVSGNIEQWIDRAKRILGPGDAVFIAPGTVHGSFNTGAGEASTIRGRTCRPLAKLSIYPIRRTPSLAYPLGRSSLIHAATPQSGSPAFRSPSAHRSKSSGRRIGSRFLRLEIRNAGSSRRKRVIALSASAILPENALLAAAKHVAIRKLGSSPIAASAHDNASSWRPAKK